LYIPLWLNVPSPQDLFPFPNLTNPYQRFLRSAVPIDEVDCPVSNKVLRTFPSLKKPPSIIDMNGNDRFLNVNDAHLRVTGGNVHASSFNLDQISITTTSTTASTIDFLNETKAFTTRSNIEVGTANLFVDTTTSNVGIRTSSPEYALDVHGTANVGALTATILSGIGTSLTALNAANITTGTLDRNTTGSAATLTTPRSIGGVNFDGSADIVPTTFGAATFDTDTLVIDSVNDRVGIGTNAPSHALNVKATSGDAEVHIQAQGNDGGDAILYFNGSSTNQRKCAIISSNVAPNAYCKQDLHFCMETTNDLTDVDITDSKMVLTNAGNVGIGNGNPLCKLDIFDTGGCTMRLTTDNVTPQGTIDIIRGDNLRSPSNYTFGASNYYDWRIGSDDTTDYNFAIRRKGGGLDTKALVIDGTSGNIGIGASPGQLLTLGGQVNPILRLQTTKAGDAWGTSSSDQYGKLQWWGYDYEMNQGNGAEMAGITVGTTSQYPGAMQMRFFVGAPTFSGGNWNLSYVGYLGTSSVSDIDFTGQHRNFIDGIPATEYTDFEGLIVSANKNKYYDVDKNVTTGVNAIQISQSLPLVSLSTKEKDKACFGVISGSEDPDTREYSQGSYVSVCEKQDGDRRAFINSVGEGAIWVTNINGSLESGDYITTSNVAGYGQKQDSDSLKNYTVAKITMDCDFDPVTQPVQIIRKELSNVNYWVKTTYENVTEEEYSNLADENRQIVDGIYQEITKEESKTEQEGYELEVRQELVNVLDEHGQLQWEDHATETEKAYKIRYLDADGNITDEANAVHTAAFVGCTYHCG